MPFQIDSLFQWPVPVIGFSPDGRIQFWNRGADQVFGLPRMRAIGRRLVELLPECIRTLFESTAQQVHSTGIARTIEFDHEDPSGYVRHFRLTVLRAGTGDAAVLVALAIDAGPETAGPSESARLRELEERLAEWIAYSRIVEACARHVSLPELLRSASKCIERDLNCDLSLLYLANPDGTLEPAAGCGIEEPLLAQMRLPGWEGIFAQVQTGDRLSIVRREEVGPPLARLRIHSAALLPLAALGAPVGAWVYAFRGPHEFSEAEKRLLLRIAGHLGVAIQRVKLYEEVAGLSLLTAINPNVILQMDGQGRVLYVNPAARKLLMSLRIDESRIDRILPAGYLDDIRSILPTQGTITGREVQIGNFSYRFLYKALGDGRRAFLSGEDITNQKIVEQMKNEFVSMVSHELRTPLTAIKGYVDLMLANDAGPLDELAKEYLGIISNNAERLLRLINELLDIDRIESGGRALKKEPVDLPRVFRRAIAFQQLHADRKGIALNFSTEEVPAILGDEDSLYEVANNLVDNAIKYTEAGEVVVRVHRNDDRVVARVKDTGIGIEPQDLPRLFTKFFRTGNARARKVPGTGLGLAIVKALVEKNGGSIRVESEPGRGTEFLLDFPAIPAGPSGPATS